MGHKHIPYAVTGVPVAPTPVPLRTVFKARLSEGIQSGFVAVITPPTALLTRRVRPTGFRSSSIFSYYKGLTGICQGVLAIFLAKGGKYLLRKGKRRQARRELTATGTEYGRRGELRPPCRPRWTLRSPPRSRALRFLPYRSPPYPREGVPCSHR